jgi:hypothetical protein
MTLSESAKRGDGLWHDCESHVAEKFPSVTGSSLTLTTESLDHLEITGFSIARLTRAAAIFYNRSRKKRDCDLADSFHGLGSSARENFVAK